MTPELDARLPMSDYQIEKRKPTGRGREGKYPWATGDGMDLDDSFIVSPGETHRTGNAARRYAANHPPIQFEIETVSGVTRCHRIV